MPPLGLLLLPVPLDFFRLDYLIAAISVITVACRFFGTLLSFAPNDDAEGRAGHKGLKRAGVSAAIYTGSTDIETECDGFYTYDRRALKYDRDAVTAAAAALLAPL